MKIRLIAVGKRQPRWIEDGFQEYAKRLPKHLGFSLEEIAPGARSGQHAERAMLEEADRIANRLGSNDRVIALDEGGKLMSTRGLADAMSGWEREGDSVSLVIGGADGLHRNVLDQAHQRWSLSGLTLPHGLVRIVVAEAIYRAHSLNRNHPYHRA